MTKFTDDDLADWKDRLRPEGDRAVVAIPIEKQRALLARLEAAEALCQQVEIYITDDTPKMFRTKKLLEVWRKECGK